MKITIHGIGRIISGLLITCFFPACGGSPATHITEERLEAEKRARLASEKLVGTLFTQLTQTIKTKGHAEAIHFCSNVAVSLTNEIGDKEGVSIRRVSFRTRNTANQPDGYESGILTSFQRLREANALQPLTFHSEIIEAEGRQVLRYLRPITLIPMCLDCHGTAETLNPDALQAIKERYPEDQATGYQAGEVRGAVSVIVPLQPSQ